MNCCGIPGCAMIPVVVLFLVAFALFACLIVTLIKTWIYCMIFHKAGYNWAWGLLTLVPIASIIMKLMLALGDWPALKELRQLRQQLGTAKP